MLDRHKFSVLPVPLTSSDGHVLACIFAQQAVECETSIRHGRPVVPGNLNIDLCPGGSQRCGPRTEDPVLPPGSLAVTRRRAESSGHSRSISSQCANIVWKTRENGGVFGVLLGAQSTIDCPRHASAASKERQSQNKRKQQIDAADVACSHAHRVHGVPASLDRTQPFRSAGEFS